MGMSASQARLLTLTARMSDLEFQAQGISNSKLRLAVQSEDVSRAYSDALNKERLSVLTGFNNQTSTYSDLSYALLTSPNMMSQYGLSTSGGGILVSKDIADKFKSVPSLDEFLVAVGQSTATVPAGYTKAAFDAAQAKVDSTKAAYLGADGTGTVSGAQAETAIALKNLDAYGGNHVQGYTSTGAWTYKANGPKDIYQSYSDKDVFATLATLSYADMFGSPLQYSEAEGTASVDKFSNNDPSYVLHGVNSFQVQVAGIVTDVSGDVTAALTKALATANIDATKFTSAIASATAATQAHYLASAIAVQTNPLVAKSTGYATVVAATVDSNQIKRDASGMSCVDITQMVKTFLDNFDAAYSGTTPPISGSVGAGTSTRSQVDALDASGAVTKTPGASIFLQTVNMDSVYTSDDVDAAQTIKYTPTGIETQASVTAQYQALLGTYNTKVTAEATAKTNYNNAIQELALVTPTYSNDGDNVKYYTNLYNRMCDGYATVDNEDQTMNNSDWIQNQITNGNLLLEKVDSDNKWNKISWKSDTSITQSTDNTDMARAEAQYSVSTAEIQTKDKKFDLELKNIETEHTAVQTEVDSVRKVIDKNIDRSFKNFQA